MPARIQGVTTRITNAPATPVAATRRTSYPGAILRNQVKPGDIFAKVLNGRLGEERYGSVGMNGKLYSINMKTGAVAASKNPTGETYVTGSYSLSAERWPTSRHQSTTRSQLRDGALFVVANKVKNDYAGKKMYAHLERLNDNSYLSINVVSGDNARSKTNYNAGNKRVVQIGEFTFVPKNGR